MDLGKLSVKKLRTELWTCHILSEQRCLRKSCEWAEDLLFALPEEGEEKLISKLEKDLNDITNLVEPQYEHAKACFELHEYDRAAHIIKNYQNFDDEYYDKSRFLHYFSLYKAAEKKRINLINDVSINLPRKAASKFNELRDSLERSMDQRAPDGWLLYVYGLVLHKFKHTKLAIEMLEKAINLTPINWSAWHILTTMIDSKAQLYNLNLPNHLFKVFFHYMMHLDLDMSTGISANASIAFSSTFTSSPSKPDHQNSLYNSKETKTFLDKYFKNSLFIKTLTAKSLSFQSTKYSEAMSIFAQIRQEDPYRIDAMEVYSNLLYVKKHKKELAKLAYDIERVDPFTPEANSCIANSYSAREQHTKAIVYFTRALRLNPDHLNSWTLIGHEYLEMKSIEKALQAYRFAISLSKRDCRAWLGLGNTYETIKSSQSEKEADFESCLYYYSQVGKYRPKDHIMFMALASIYEKMKIPYLAMLCKEQAGKEESLIE